jgi:hypothetical protein
VRILHRPRHQVIHEPEAAKLQGLASRRGPRVHELANGLRLGTTVPSQDLSGAWVTVWGREPARASGSP